MIIFKNNLKNFLFRFHLVAQTNLVNQPMLVNEYALVEVNVSNSFNIVLQNVGISISVPTNLINKGKFPFYNFELGFKVVINLFSLFILL